MNHEHNTLMMLRDEEGMEIQIEKKLQTGGQSEHSLELEVHAKMGSR
jgi:hypothetical protein